MLDLVLNTFMGNDCVSHLDNPDKRGKEANLFPFCPHDVPSFFSLYFYCTWEKPWGWREASWSSHHNPGYTQPACGVIHEPPPLHVRLFICLLQFSTMLSSLASHSFSSSPLLSPTRLPPGEKHSDTRERALDLKTPGATLTWRNC